MAGNIRFEIIELQTRVANTSKSCGSLDNPANNPADDANYNLYLDLLGQLSSYVDEIISYPGLTGEEIPVLRELLNAMSESVQKLIKFKNARTDALRKEFDEVYGQADKLSVVENSIQDTINTINSGSGANLDDIFGAPTTDLSSMSPAYFDNEPSSLDMDINSYNPQDNSNQQSSGGSLGTAKVRTNLPKTTRNPFAFDQAA